MNYRKHSAKVYKRDSVEVHSVCYHVCDMDGCIIKSFKTKYEALDYMDFAYMHYASQPMQIRKVVTYKLIH